MRTTAVAPIRLDPMGRSWRGRFMDVRFLEEANRQRLVGGEEHDGRLAERKCPGEAHHGFPVVVCEERSRCPRSRSRCCWCPRSPQRLDDRLVRDGNGSRLPRGAVPVLDEAVRPDHPRVVRCRAPELLRPARRRSIWVCQGPLPGETLRLREVEAAVGCLRAVPVVLESSPNSLLTPPSHTELSELRLAATRYSGAG